MPGTFRAQSASVSRFPEMWLSESNTHSECFPPFSLTGKAGDGEDAMTFLYSFSAPQSYFSHQNHCCPTRCEGVSFMKNIGAV